MTVYNITTLKNIYTRRHVKEAVKKLYISAETAEKIYAELPVDLYTPNLFVKIGLGVLTVFISLCSVGLIALFFDVNNLFGIFLTMMGIVSYIFLEYMTGQKKHYNFGVDSVLMFAVVLFIVWGMSSVYSQSSDTLVSFIALILCAWFALRFADRLAALIATLAFLSFVFYTYSYLGEFTISSFPYVLIAVSGCLYFISNKVAGNTKDEVYRPLLQTVAIVALLAFYFSGNNYVVQNLAESNYLLQKNSPLSFPWFFWAWTMLFPIVCLVRGIKNKDILLIRVGIVLMAVSVLTFRYYYSIVSPEAAMFIAGILLLVVSYLLMRYLALPKHGFVFDDKMYEESDTENLEGFVIGQTVGGHNQPAKDTRPGGGSFGGAGAGSNY